MTTPGGPASLARPASPAASASLAGPVSLTSKLNVALVKRSMTPSSPGIARELPVLPEEPSRRGPGGAMTQLARPDLARSRSGRDDETASPPVPGWVVATALLGPAVLVA